MKLVGFTDSDWVSSQDDMKSTLTYMFSLGSSIFSWNSKKQSVVAQSTVETEYITVVAVVNQAIWLRKVLADVGFEQDEAIEIYCDKKSAIAMTKNPAFYGRRKHIKIKFHCVRQAETEGEVKLIHCSSEDQLANALTKALPKPRFETLRSLLGVSNKIVKEEC